MSKTVGETLRQTRVSKDLGLREFAKKLHLNPQALGNIEHNHSLPSDTILANAADYLGLDFSTLAHQRDNPPSLNPVYSIRFGPCIVHGTKCAAEARVWHSTKGPLFKNDGSTLGEELEKMPREPGCGTCNICKTEKTCRECDTPYQQDDDINYCKGCDTWICTTCNDSLVIPIDHPPQPKPTDDTFRCQFCKA